MEPQSFAVLVGIVSAIGGAGGSWGAARQRIKHTEQEVIEVKHDLAEHQKTTRVMGERLARMEGKIDTLISRGGV